jgi:WD40 repeat protein
VATLDDRGVLEVWRSGHGSARRVKKMLVDPGPGEQPEKAARKVAFSPDGHQLAATSRRTGVGREAAGGTDGTVEFLVSAWDTNRPGPSGGSPLLYRERLSAEPVSLTVSEPVVVRGAESYFTAVAEKGGNVEIFSPRGRVVHTIEGMQDVVHLAFSKSANESLVLTVVTDDQVTLWQLCEGRLGFEKRRDRALGDETFMGHADGRPVIMLANFSEMKVIDLEVADDEPVFVAEGQFSAGAVSPNLEYLVTLAVDHETLSLWGVEAGPESEHGEAIARWRPSDGKVREFYATNDDHVMVFAEDALTIWSVNPLGWVTQGCRILSFLGGWDWDVKTACLASNLL